MILGGDVLEKNQEGSLELNGSGWFSERKGPSESYKSYCQRSREETLNYIKSYPKEKVFFAPILVMSLQLVYKCLSNQSLSDVS